MEPVVPVVTPVQQPVVERHTTVDRSGMSSEASVILILAGIAVLALVWYLAWYRPQSSQTIIETQPTIERSTTEIRTEPAPVINNPPPIVVQPPARTETPTDNDTVIINPPASEPAPTGEATTGG